VFLSKSMRFIDNPNDPLEHRGNTGDLKLRIDTDKFADTPPVDECPYCDRPKEQSNNGPSRGDDENTRRDADG